MISTPILVGFVSGCFTLYWWRVKERKRFLPAASREQIDCALGVFRILRAGVGRPSLLPPPLPVQVLCPFLRRGPVFALFTSSRRQIVRVRPLFGEDGGRLVRLAGHSVRARTGGRSPSPASRFFVRF